MCLEAMTPDTQVVISKIEKNKRVNSSFFYAGLMIIIKVQLSMAGIMNLK